MLDGDLRIPYTTNIKTTQREENIMLGRVLTTEELNEAGLDIAEMCIPQILFEELLAGVEFDFVETGFLNEWVCCVTKEGYKFNLRKDFVKIA